MMRNLSRMRGHFSIALSNAGSFRLGIGSDTLSDAGSFLSDAGSHLSKAGSLSVKAGSFYISNVLFRNVDFPKDSE